MTKSLLLLFGILILVLEFFIFSVPEKIQFIFFITGILTLGVPHGAADLLVAIQNAKGENKPANPFVINVEKNSFEFGYHDALMEQKRFYLSATKENLEKFFNIDSKTIIKLNSLNKK